MSHTYHGSCHCGSVQFELQAEDLKVMECNCTICRRRGAIWHGTVEPNLRILQGEEDLVLYQYHTNTAKHYFCRHCGIHPFGRPRLDPKLWVVNVRCIDSVDLRELEIGLFDGANWEEAAAAFMKSRG
jgi:hypothetical protein